MESLISVIIPVYKVEPYLRRCVESVLNQTYQNLEVILVDDGSPDNCGAICDEYAVLDSRVKVIHKANGGQGETRNAGLEIATGEYVSFVDSDDWLDGDLFRRVMDHAPFDMSIYGVVCVDEGTEAQSRICAATEPSRIKKLDNDTSIMGLISNSLFGYAGNKIYRREKIADIRYQHFPLREDLLFNLQVYGNVEEILLLDKEGYFYLQRKNSTLHSSYYGAIPPIADFALKLIENCPEARSEVKRQICNLMVHQYLLDALYRYVFLNGAISEKEALGTIRQVFQNRQIVKTLRLRGTDDPLHMLFVCCAKTRNSRLFYYLMKRKWYAKT